MLGCLWGGSGISLRLVLLSAFRLCPSTKPGDVLAPLRWVLGGQGVQVGHGPGGQELSVPSALPAAREHQAGRHLPGHHAARGRRGPGADARGQGGVQGKGCPRWDRDGGGQLLRQLRACPWAAAPSCRGLRAPGLCLCPSPKKIQLKQ